MNEGRSGSTTVVGRNPVREALDDSSIEIEKVLIKQGAGGSSISEIRRLAHERGVPVQFVPVNKLDRLAAGASHQGVAAVTSPVPYLDLNDVLQAIAPDRESVNTSKPILLLLDGIQDPHNFGAILRSAVAADVAAVIVPRHGMAPVSSVTVKASAGTAGRIPLARVGNLGNTLYELKERGFWIAGADGLGETSMWEMDWDRPLAIVIGSEGKGLSRRVADECDYRVRIPISERAESLNASVAAGILLFVATRPRLH
ncbi:MAG: 23S rRNA (guanosine(2251)-2'-O)-methyltransferase RlmB [Bacteroidota bacterium]